MARRGEGPAGTVSSSPPPPLLMGWGEGGGRGDRLFFTVWDLIAHRFHYLRTNVTFTSDQGQGRRWQPARLQCRKYSANQSTHGRQRRGTARLEHAKDVKNKGQSHTQSCRFYYDRCIIRRVKCVFFVLIATFHWFCQYDTRWSFWMIVIKIERLPIDKTKRKHVQYNV